MRLQCSIFATIGLLALLCSTSLGQSSSTPSVEQLSAGEAPLVRTEVHLVNLSFLVHDQKRQLVANLTQDDLAVYEDGIPQKISIFAKEEQLPLTLGLIVDVSSSQDKFIKRHEKDIKVFLQRVLRPEDQAFAICFGNHLRLVSDLTSSPQQISDGLHRFDKGDRDFPEFDPDRTRDAGTALFDALTDSIQERLAKVPNRRKALIVFTDGEDNSSANDLFDTIAAAQDSDVLIYAIRYTQEEKGKLTSRNKYGIRTLSHLAQQTGGNSYDALKIDIPQSFEEIGDELRSMYSLAYHSTNKLSDGSFRKVSIVSKKPDLSIRSKPGYYAR